MPLRRTKTEITQVNLLFALGCLTILSTLAYTIYGVIKSTGQNSQRNECYNSSQINLDSNDKSSINGRTEEKKVTCFYFYASSNHLLNLDSNTKIRVITPKGQSFLVQGKVQEYLKDDGEYLIRIDADSSPKSYSINVSLKDIKKENIQQGFTAGTKSNLLSYNSKENSIGNNNSRTQELVNSAVNLAREQGFPIDKLSVSLINLNDNSHGEHQDQIPRFPASLSKLFWLIALFGHYDANRINQDEISEEDLKKMMQDSDNNAASRVLDKLTNTNSGDFLSSDQFEKWSTQRKTINYYFQSAGYKNINISQKNFPIPDLKLKEPSGRDKQMRGDISNPTRNFVTANSVARILLDIEKEKAISPLYSQYAKSLMKRDFSQEKLKQYDSIKGFLGGGLNSDQIYQFSKPGWTGDSRQDAAIIYSRDGKVRYILVVIGDSKEFAQDWQIFPKLSQLIFDRLSN